MVNPEGLLKSVQELSKVPYQQDPVQPFIIEPFMNWYLVSQRLLSVQLADGPPFPLGHTAFQKGMFFPRLR